MKVNNVLSGDKIWPQYSLVTMFGTHTLNSPLKMMIMVMLSTG